MLKSPPISAAYQKLLSAGRLSPNAEQAALSDQLGRLQQTLTSRSSWLRQKKLPSNNGFYIYGGVGTGKSRIADLFASTLPAQVRYRRAHFFEFMTDVHTRLHRARSSANYLGDPLISIGHEVQNESPVLCLDEFQVSDIADAMILKRLFGAFWDRGGILISTSNRHPTELYKNGLNRSLFLPFIEELQQRCTIFRMHGNHDYRMDNEKQHSREDVFFTNPTDFQKSCTKATNGLPFEAVEIPVAMSRKLKVYASQPEGTKAVVSGDFSALCEAFLGSTDYHALCNFASTVYLSGLRRFAADEFDVVRRFITLVDIAYESKTRILCLSTDPILDTFKNIVLSQQGEDSTNEPVPKLQNLIVKGEGGSSSSMMSTFMNDVEWSATGLTKASLATGGAGETDVRFAVVRAISRLHEMSSEAYGGKD